MRGHGAVSGLRGLDVRTRASPHPRLCATECSSTSLRVDAQSLRRSRCLQNRPAGHTESI